MSIIHKIQCNACGFTLLQGTGTAMFVKKPAGFFRKLFGLGDSKSIVPDPSVRKIPGDRDMQELIADGHMGHSSAWFCKSCHKVIQLDSDSPKKCSACKSSDIQSVFEMVGQKCIKCNSGVFEDIRLGIT